MTASRRSLVASLASLVCLHAVPAAQKTPDVHLGAADDAVGAVMGTWRSNVAVAWIEAGDVFFRCSLDRGRTWTDAVQLDASPPSGTALSVAIAVNQSMVYVVWAESQGGPADVYANRSLDGGLSWLPAKVRLDVDTPAGAADSRLPQVAAKGWTVYVAWQEGSAPATDIHFNRSLDRGDTWLPAEVRLDLGTAPYAVASEAPRIAASDKGPVPGASSVCVVWQDASGTEIRSNRSLDEGTTWLPTAVRVDSAASGASVTPRIVMMAGTAHVVWADDRAGTGQHDVYYDRSSDRGETWLPSDVRLDVATPAGAVHSHEPELTVDATRVYAVWTDGSVAGDVRFNRSLDSGGTWLSSDVQIDVSTTPGSASQPRVAANGQGVYVLYTTVKRSPSVQDVMTNRSIDFGTTWLAEEVRVSLGADPDPMTNALVASGPSVDARDGSAFALWSDDRASSGDLGVHFTLLAGHQPYGTGLYGTGFVTPRLEATGQASPGGILRVQVTHGVGLASGLLAYGLSGSAPTPLAGGILWVQPPLVTLPISLDGFLNYPGTGSLNLPIPLPSSPSLVGQRIDLQAGFADRGAPQGLSLTNALETWIL